MLRLAVFFVAMFVRDELSVSPIPCSAVGSSPDDKELPTSSCVTSSAVLVADMDMSRRTPPAPATHSPAMAARRADAKPATSTAFITTLAAAPLRSASIASRVRHSRSSWLASEIVIWMIPSTFPVATNCSNIPPDSWSRRLTPVLFDEGVRSTCTSAVDVALPCKLSTTKATNVTLCESPPPFGGAGRCTSIQLASTVPSGICSAGAAGVMYRNSYVNGRSSPSSTQFLSTSPNVSTEAKPFVGCTTNCPLEGAVFTSTEISPNPDSPEAQLLSRRNVYVAPGRNTLALNATLVSVKRVETKSGYRSTSAPLS
mmetsp:Transcript_39284/g.80476  ORF Transcript_39284/g.80476 Transcript_39284/m.80476 type:complete len:314 (+) Transcript_39284:1599-2540(+)